MSAAAIVAVIFAGVGAGAINSIVGSGSLLTFPLLLAIGYSPVAANASNTLGVVPGAVLGAYGYKAELKGQGPFLVRLAVASILGGTLGAVLFLVLAPSVFKAVVLVLIGLALVLIMAQPLIARRAGTEAGRSPSRALSPGLFFAVFLVAIYGGYFGGGQGIMLLAILGLFLRESLQNVNGTKNVLAATANAVAAIAFTIAGHIAWEPALLLAAGSGAGGMLGSRFGLKLSPKLLRAIIVTVGVLTIVRLA